LSAIPAPNRAQTTPASAAQPVSPRPSRVEIIALTGDDELLEQIGQTLDGETTIRPADSVDAAREFIRPMRPSVLLLDARGHSALGAIVESLQAPDGSCIVVVLAPAAESSSVSSTLRGSATFAILPIPVDPGQTMAVLEGAREEALARCTLAAQSSASVTAAAAPEPTPSPAPIAIRPSALPLSSIDRDRAPRSRKPIGAADAGGIKRRAPIAIPAVVALVAIAAAWLALREPSPDERTPDSPAAAAQPASRDTPAPAAATIAVPGGSVDELLDKARAALGARHYTEPEGDNALAYFRAVLVQDPANDEAREGMQRIATLLDERLQSETAQRKFGDAAGTLAQLRLLRPGDAGLAQVDGKLAEAQIAAAIDAGNIERASQLLLQASERGTLTATNAARWRDEIARRQGDVRAQQLAQLVATRIREDKLVDPANDSAKSYLAQLRKLPTDPKGLGSAATANLQQAYLLKIRVAAAQSQRAELDRWLAEARALSVSPTRLAAAMRSATPVPAAPVATSQSDRLAQLVQDRIRDGSLLEPVQDSALAYLSALRTQDPTGSATTASARALSAALLESGRNALTNRHFDSAQASASAARRLGLNLADVDALDRAIGAARTTPAPLTNLPPEVKRTRYVPPDYPKDALKGNVHGEVRVRITIAADGKVKSATIVDSSPARVFDDAALDAVRRWRFKPLSGDNPDVEATAVADIVFQPEAVKKP
jgi:protein TonB